MDVNLVVNLAAHSVAQMVVPRVEKTVVPTVV